MQEYHVPVLLNPSVDALVYDPDGIYADATFGGGGHSRAILKKLSAKGKLVAFDRDDESLANAPDDRRFTLVHHNFRFLKQFMRYGKMLPLNGILADLGISSQVSGDLLTGLMARWICEWTKNHRLQQQTLSIATPKKSSNTSSNFGEKYPTLDDWPVRFAREEPGKPSTPQNN
jgi:hypothetical protein